MSSEENKYRDPKELAKYIIHKTPIGLLDQSMYNLKILLKGDILTSPEILKELNIYKQNHLIPFEVKNAKTKVIVSPYNKDNEDFYYDQIQKIRFKLNDKYEPENVEEYTINTEIFRKIWRRMDEYIKKYYNAKAVNYNVYHNAILDKVQIIISGKICNNKNYWTGEWLSVWELDIEQKKMEGEIKVNTMYYEDSNVQFNLKKNYEEKNKGKDESSLADELMNFIEKNENDVQDKIKIINENISEEYVKSLRKRISLVDKDMNWSLDQIQLKK
jgi:hypothetical protein